MYDDKMHSDLEILGLNAETIWFGSLFAMQTMLSGFKEWELDKICNGNEDIAGDFARRVSFFHEKTLIPVTQYVKNNHKPPSFAVDVLKCMSSHGRNQIFDLHAKLLCGASEKLVKCYDKDCGRSVAAEIEKWFAVLKDAVEAFVPFASDDTITELQQVVEAYELKEDVSSGSSSNEHENEEEVSVFFCHKFLFIRVAYMVEFYTNASAKMKTQAMEYTFLALGNDQRKRWGSFSGNLIQGLFQHDCGLTVLDREMATKGYIEKCIEKGKFKFPMIDYLPYRELADCNWKNRGQLSLSELQESVLCQMFGNIRAKCLNEMRQSNGKGDRHQLKQLEKIFSVAVHTAEKELHTLRNREKVRKCLKKKKVIQSRPRRNRKRQGPEIFMWDVFIMGSNSYFYQFRDISGTALREFYKKCNARGQLFHERAF